MIPREQDMVRLYVELGLEDGLLDTASGRIAVGKIGPERILEVSSTSRRFFNVSPYPFTDYEACVRTLCLGTSLNRLVDCLH